MKKTTLILDEKVYKAVKQMAVEQETTMQRLINEALEHLVAKKTADQEAYRQRVIKTLEAMSHMRHKLDFDWEKWEEEYERTKGTCEW